MYALVRTGGKQYRVAKDDTILVERIAADEGAEVILDDVVMLGDGDKVTIGTPRVEGAAVSATVVSQTRGPKIIIFRRKRRKNHRRTQGHRQDLTLLKINAIAEDGKSLKPKAAPAKKAAAKEESESGAEGRSQGSTEEGSCQEDRRQKGNREESGCQESGKVLNSARGAHQQLKGAGKWHIKKQVVAHVTVATQPVAVLA